MPGGMRTAALRVSARRVGDGQSAVTGARIDRHAASERARIHTAKLSPTTIANQPCGENGPLPAVTASGPTRLISASGTPIRAIHRGSTR